MFVLAMTAMIVSKAVSGGITLTGTIRDEDGSPLAGAMVDIYTAKPRIGTATTCPSCYRDCAKSTKTESDGQFSIGELDPGLLFRVLVMAPGRRSHLTAHVDPLSTQIDVALKSVPQDLPDDRLLTGRVVSVQGEPIAGAVVTPVGAKTKESHWFGQLPGVDQASITDADGRFVITSQAPKLGLYLQVSAPGYASFAPQLFDLDSREHQIPMQLGASVLGRLMFEGQPIKNRSVGIVQRDRSVELFVGERVLATDHTGSFQFTDLQPNQSYVLYTLCEPSQPVAGTEALSRNPPALKTRSLVTADVGGVTQLGDLELEPGLTLSGKVTFPADSKAPEEVKLRLSRDPAWDWYETFLSDSGEFKIYGLPPEVYKLSIQATGFEIDASRMRYQTTGPSELAFRLRVQGNSTLFMDIPMKSKAP
jgi:hypothetical protein